MRYIFLIYRKEMLDTQATFPAQQARQQASAAFAAEARDSIRSGETLLPTTTATTIRRGAGQWLILDCPYAETIEQLSGYYVVECDHLDDALALARKIPDAQTG